MRVTQSSSRGLLIKCIPRAGAKGGRCALLAFHSLAGVAFCVPLTRGGDCVHSKFSKWNIESLLDTHELATRILFCGVGFQSFGLPMESRIIELERRRQVFPFSVNTVSRVSVHV